MADDGRETKIEPDDVKSELSDLDDSVVAEESAAEAIRKLREKLNVCQSERREYLEGWQRAKADYVNTRREEEAARARFLKFSREDAIKDILPGLDSFHSAFGDQAAW